MEFTAKWISAPFLGPDAVPRYEKAFAVEKPVKEARLYCTALGVYRLLLNDAPVSSYVLAPGWTVYRDRLQVQCYDVTALLKKENRLTALVGRGWYSSRLGWIDKIVEERRNAPKGLLLELQLTYEDGSEEVIASDESFLVRPSNILFSEIYDGEKFDASFDPETVSPVPAVCFDYGYETLIPQEGEEIREQERISGKKVIVTPAGEVLIDFEQEVTGYTEFTVDAHEGDRIVIRHGEVLDKYGNFYNDNYRSAKAEISYICREGKQTWHPALTFFGFRYLKLESWPEAADRIDPAAFTAIAVYSAIRRTGQVESSDPKLNRLFENVFWGQRGNFLDVPTDCPQRDERLGWTGDAEVFCKTASYNFDVRRFFKKWLHDVKADQFPDGGIPHVVPDILSDRDLSEIETDAVKSQGNSAAWGDAAVICPWQIYETYADVSVLADQFDSMKGWVDYIGSATKDPYLWTGGTHFGDWLGLDAPQGSYKGSSREDLIASAYYAYSTSLLIKAGKVLGKDVSAYEERYPKIVAAYRKAFPEFRTQTEHVVTLMFGLAEDPEKTAADLAAMVERDGSMKTGFVGTPLILYALADYGRADLAYDLLLREEYPSWLYAVNRGATTIWEHWDGIMENGDFWSRDMNSFNHYSYGAVLSWVYERAAGITPLMPGFRRIRIAPVPTDRLTSLSAAIDTVSGRVSSRWTHTEKGTVYELTLPVSGEAVIDGVTYTLEAGSYRFVGR